ncbi:MAG: 3-deoxy-manno-octulosonate cytidylyltransferase [Nitrospirae bacterium]|nr:3-deoxy-manno-octulosonate cytidylyltransferase [Nitrospirota bacterium]
MSAIVIIPSRLGSTRLPGKPLIPIKGKPLIQHVYENSMGSKLAEEVIVATDSKRILETVTSFGGKAVMTSMSHLSGTDRVSEASLKLDYDIIVNVQGDEPLIRGEMIDDVIELLEDKRASVGTLARKIQNPKEILNPNVVKVVFDKEGFALYFSRSPIPYHRDKWKTLNLTAIQNSGVSLYKHIGIYSYRKSALIRLSEMNASHLEETERLEQLRALEAGMRIKVRETSFDTIGVDTEKDIKKVERCLSLSL